jgi:hypothetical protein
MRFGQVHRDDYIPRTGQSDDPSDQLRVHRVRRVRGDAGPWGRSFDSPFQLRAYRLHASGRESDDLVEQDGRGAFVETRVTLRGRSRNLADRRDPAGQTLKQSRDNRSAWFAIAAFSIADYQPNPIGERRPRGAERPS